MTESELDFFSAEFDKYDKESNGKISKNDFLFLYRALETDETKEREESDIIFNGIDIESTEFIAKNEFLNLVKQFKERNMLFLYKIVFRSFDKDKSKTLNPDEIVDYMIFCKKSITRKAAETEIMRFGAKELNFAQMHYILTGKTIDPDIDPYDGMLERKKTSCCEII
jgi:Ca2+-binding EF-hand superfamily protein